MNADICLILKQIAFSTLLISFATIKGSHRFIFWHFSLFLNSSLSWSNFQRQNTLKLSRLQTLDAQKNSIQQFNISKFTETFYVLRKLFSVPNFFWNLKVFQRSRKFSEGQKTFQTVWKVSRVSRIFPGCPKTFHGIN